MYIKIRKLNAPLFDFKTVPYSLQFVSDRIVLPVRCIHSVFPEVCQHSPEGDCFEDGVLGRLADTLNEIRLPPEMLHIDGPCDKLPFYGAVIVEETSKRGVSEVLTPWPAFPSFFPFALLL